MREIVFDTETTGLDPRTGDRLVEIGGVELLNRFPTGRTYHQYINPQRDVPLGAYEVHGLSTEFLSDKPLFEAIVDEFLEFIGEDGILVAHNASFDMGFINLQLEMTGRPRFPGKRVVDTLQLARHKHPAGPNSLDALCSRYSINNEHRTFHGALLDSELLAKVYIELLGGTQAAMAFDGPGGSGENSENAWKAEPRQQALPPRISDEDRAKHGAFIRTFSGRPIWEKYISLPKVSDSSD